MATWEDAWSLSAGRRLEADSVFRGVRSDGHGGQHEELYNLKEDIGETKNLTDTEPEKRAELSAKLTAWQQEIEALIPEPNPEYVLWTDREPPGHFAAEE